MMLKMKTLMILIAVFFSANALSANYSYETYRIGHFQTDGLNVINHQKNQNKFYEFSDFNVNKNDEIVMKITIQQTSKLVTNEELEQVLAIGIAKSDKDKKMLDNDTCDLFLSFDNGISWQSPIAKKAVKSGMGEATAVFFKQYRAEKEKILLKLVSKDISENESLKPPFISYAIGFKTNENQVFLTNCANHMCFNNRQFKL